MMIGKSTIALIAVALVGILVVSGTPMLSLMGAVDTSTVEKTYKGGHSDWGVVTGHVELDQTDYAVGWKPGAEPKSEKFLVSQDPKQNVTRASYIDISGKATISFGVIDAGYARVEKIWYEWYIDDTLIKKSAYQKSGVDKEKIGGSSGTFSQENTERHYLGEGSATTTKEGVSTLEVRLYGDVSFYTQDFPHVTGSWSTPTTKLLSSDKARLHSGAGSVKIGGKLQDVVEVGEKAQFFVETGYTRGEGWDLYVVPPAGSGQQRYLYKSYGDNVGETDSIEIPANWFTYGGENRVELQLYNNLWKEASSTFFSIDDKELQPSIGDVRLSSTKVNIGDSVKLTMEATPNEKSNESIDKFFVQVYYGEQYTQPGDSDAWIYYNKYVTATDKDGDGVYEGELDFQTAYSGNVVARVNAQDSAGRTSEGKYAQLSSYDPDKGDGGGGGGDGGGGDGGYPFVWNIYAVSILIVGLFGAIAWLMYGPQDPPSAMVGIPKIIPTLLILIITLVMVYMTGTNPHLSEFVLF